MEKLYVPKSTKTKTEKEITEIVAKYLTNGRYDQKKSDMIATTYRNKAGIVQKNQAVQRKVLRESALVFKNFENLISKTLIWVEEPSQMISPSPVQVAPVQAIPVNLPINNFRTPGALVRTLSIANNIENKPSVLKRRPSQRTLSSFATGRARL